MQHAGHHKVLLLLGRFPPPYDGQSLTTARFEKLIESDYEVVRINASTASDASLIEKVRRYVDTGSRLKEALDQYPDAVIVWQSISPQPTGHFRDVLTVLPRIRGRHSLAVVHWGDFDRVFQSPLTRWTAPKLATAVDKFVFLDDDLSDACSPWLRAVKRAVMPNCVDYETLCTESEVDTKRAVGLLHGLRVLYLSNMIESKGYLDVARAASLLKESGMDIQFDFVGNWYTEQSRTAFEGLIKSEGIQDQVHVHGPITDRAEVKALHLAAHIFVLPSYYPTEAQPVSIIEALSAGTPVISTYHGGIPGMVTDGKEAFLIPIKSPQSIADAIVSLSDQTTWLDMSLRARMRFLEKYHPDVIRRQWMDLLESIGSRPVESA